MATRRELLKWTITASVVLSSGVASIQWLQKEDFDKLYHHSSNNFSFLTERDQIILYSICPVVLGKEALTNWSDHKLSLHDLMKRVDQAIVFFSQTTRDELRQLLDVLWNRLGKLLVSGIWSSWSNASHESIEAFLHSWRNSWLTSLQQGYVGLQQLIYAGYYSSPESWVLCGYDGPPRLNG